MGCLSATAADASKGADLVEEAESPCVIYKANLDIIGDSMVHAYTAFACCQKWTAFVMGPDMGKLRLSIQAEKQMVQEIVCIGIFNDFRMKMQGSGYSYTTFALFAAFSCSKKTACSA